MCIQIEAVGHGQLTCKFDILFCFWSVFLSSFSSLSVETEFRNWLGFPRASWPPESGWRGEQGLIVGGFVFGFKLRGRLWLPHPICNSTVGKHPGSVMTGPCCYDVAGEFGRVKQGHNDNPSIYKGV
jgi:hypothetical protein